MPIQMEMNHFHECELLFADLMTLTQPHHLEFVFQAVGLFFSPAHSFDLVALVPPPVGLVLKIVRYCYYHRYFVIDHHVHHLVVLVVHPHPLLLLLENLTFVGSFHEFAAE